VQAQPALLFKLAPSFELAPPVSLASPCRMSGDGVTSAEDLVEWR